MGGRKETFEKGGEMKKLFLIAAMFSSVSHGGVLDTYDLYFTDVPTATLKSQISKFRAAGDCSIQNVDFVGLTYGTGTTEALAIADAKNNLAFGFTRANDGTVSGYGSPAYTAGSDTADVANATYAAATDNAAYGIYSQLTGTGPTVTRIKNAAGDAPLPVYVKGTGNYVADFYTLMTPKKLAQFYSQVIFGALSAPGGAGSTDLRFGTCVLANNTIVNLYDSATVANNRLVKCGAGTGTAAPTMDDVTLADIAWSLALIAANN